MANRSAIYIDVLAATDKAIKDLERLQKEVDDLKTSGKSADTAFKQVTGTFGGLKTAFAGLVGAFALAEIGRAAVDLNKVGAEAIDIETTFSRLPGSTQLFADLKEAIKGTVPDIELMRNTLKGIDLGATNEQLKVFAEFARFQSVRTGVDTIQTLGAIQGAVFRQSTELLDNFGLSLAEVNGKIDELATAAGKNANALSQVERQAFLANAVMQIMRDRMAAAGEVATTSAERNRAAAAEFENLYTRVGKLVAVLGGPLVEGFRSAVAGVEAFLDAVGAGGVERVAELTSEFASVKKGAEANIKSLEALAKRYQELQEISDPTAEQQAELARVTKEVGEAYGGATRQVNDQGEAIAISLPSLQAYIEAQKALLSFKETRALDRIREAVIENADAYEDARKALQRYSEDLDRLQNKYPTEEARQQAPDIVTGGRTGAAEGLQRNVLREFTRLGNAVKDAAEQTRILSSEFDVAVQAASNFFDLSSIGAAELGSRLDVPDEVATRLILRYKELQEEAKKATVAGQGGAAGDAGAAGGNAAAKLTSGEKQQIDKKIEAAKLKEQLDQVELDRTLSNLERQKEAIRIRYDAEIAAARGKSEELAALLEEERDRQIEIITRRQETTARTQVDERITAAREKARIDELELDRTLSKIDREKAAIRIRYESEISGAREKSAELAALLEEERDRQLAILTQQQNEEIDKRIETTEEIIRQKRREIAADENRFSTLREKALASYETEIRDIETQIAQKERLFQETADEEVRIELDKLRRLRRIRREQYQAELDGITASEAQSLNINLDIKPGTSEEKAKEIFQKTLNEANSFYALMTSMAGDNAELLARIEQEKAAKIQAINADMTDYLQGLYQEQAISLLDSLSVYEAGYDTFIANVLDKEQTGAEKREAILEAMQQTAIRLLGDYLKQFIVAKFTEQTVETTTQQAKTTVQATAAAQQAAIDAGKIASSQAASAAQTGEAASGFFKAHSGIPFVGFAIAAGFVAAMIAMLASIKGKARGGLVREEDLTRSPLTPDGDDGLSGLAVGEYVIPAASVNPMTLPVLESIKDGRGLSGLADISTPLPSLNAPALPFLAGGAGSREVTTIIEKTDRLQPVNVVPRIELELIEASGAKVLRHYQYIEDDVLEPHRNEKNRNRRSNPGEVL